MLPLSLLPTGGKASCVLPAPLRSGEDMHTVGVRVTVPGSRGALTKKAENQGLLLGSLTRSQVQRDFLLSCLWEPELKTAN